MFVTYVFRRYWLEAEHISEIQDMREYNQKGHIFINLGQFEDETLPKIMQI